MKEHRRNLLFAVALVGLALVVLRFTGENDNPVLRIAVESGGGEVLPLLPVPLTITVSNRGSQPVEAVPLHLELPPASPKSGISLDLSMYRWAVESNDGRSVVAAFADRARWPLPGLDWGGADPKRNKKTALAPGEHWVLDYCLGYGLVADGQATTAGLVFPEPGRYEVRLEMPYLVTSGTVSNEIAVTVLEPSTEQDRRALAILRESPYPQVFCSRFGGLFGAGATYPTPPELVEPAERILTECPDSAYAPYAKLLAGLAMVEVGVKSTEPDEAKKRANLERRAAGYGVLRECAADENLPRRYRETALARLQGASNLAGSFRSNAREAAVPLETILGGPVPDVGIPEGFILPIMRDIEQGRADSAYEKLFREKLTAEQFETLLNFVRSNPAAMEAAGVSPLMDELRGHAEWAGDELRKLPWRDPITGQILWK